MIRLCSLYSGSSGNCIFLDADGTRILIDAGMSGKRILEALALIGEKPSDLSAVLVSHEHIDHVRGAGILSRKFNLPLFANENTWESMAPMIGPVKYENRQYFNTGTGFNIQGLLVEPFPIPHDAVEPVGFNFFCGDRKITVATDIGHINPFLLERMEGSSLLLLESNHDVEMLRIGPYPWSLKKRILGDHGHLSNDMAAKVVVHMAERGTRRFLLGHLSRENNFPELAYQTVCNALQENGICIGQDITLGIALRDRVGEMITL